jgi:hypothetical protein
MDFTVFSASPRRDRSVIFAAYTQQGGAKRDQIPSLSTTLKPAPRAVAPWKSYEVLPLTDGARAKRGLVPCRQYTDIILKDWQQ